MVSNCIDPVLHDLKFVLNNLQTNRDPFILSFSRDVVVLQQNLRLLMTFLFSARKWKKNDVCLESQDKKKVSLQFLLSSIEDNVNKYAVEIHFLCLRKESELVHLEGFVSALEPVVSSFQEYSNSLKEEILNVCISLSDSSSLQCSSCLRHDELVELMDSVLQNLVDLHSVLRVCYTADHDYVPHAQVKLETLEDKLLFLKNLIHFSILRGIEHVQLEALLTHIHVASLNALRLCYMCSFYYGDAWDHQSKMCSLISELLSKTEAVDLHVYERETCIKVLRASETSAYLHSVDMDKHIILNFNDSLVCSLWDLFQCSLDCMDSVKAQVQILYAGLRFFGSILRKPEENVDELIEKIGALIGQAGIIICSLYMDKVKVREDNSLQVRDATDCYATLVNTNSAIKLIVEQISGSSMIGGLPSYHCYTRPEVHKTSSLVPSKGKLPVTHEVVVGFDDEAKTVVDRLIRGSEQLEVVPIVGMPGLGKTTLAKKVFNNPSVLHHFHIRFWCCVSQAYNKKNVLLQILFEGKYSRTSEELKEDDLLEMLYRKLKRNKYLIVFDDVWDLGVWNDLKFSFSNDKNGSRILFTSRFSNVASEIEIGREPHNLRSLTDGESWELLQRKVFGKEDCPQAMHELGMEIAKSCKGLPLTLVTIAGVLATVDYDGWQEVAIMFTSSMVYDTDLCKNSLQLSYEHLPHYLKPCLLYFGAFPEDREIETNKLMWLWIAEGFVPNTEPKRLEDVAEDYMMDLVSRNLVMVSKQKSMGGVKSCYIHDLLHEFCKFKAEEENFLQMLQGYDELSVFNVPPNLPRLSICSKQEHFKKSRIYAPNLSSLLFFNQVEEYGWSKMADISFVYCIYKHLRVLDLEPIWLNCKDFPNEINVLVQLRYLAIRGGIEVIPPSVANLSHLETFLVTTHYGVGTVSLPETIWIMKNLRHLHIMGYSPCCFPNCNLENSSKLHNLDTLSILFVSSGKCLEEIVKKIPNIRQLEIKLSEAKESSGYSLESLNQLESLESLKVSSNSFHLQHDIEYCFPSILKELILDYLFLPWSKISLVEELPNLEVLKLLGDSFKGTRWDMKGGGFPKLRVLWLERLDIVEWTDTDCEGDCFPCLEKLLLVGAMLKLEIIPSCLMSIPTLEMIKLETAKDNESLVSLVRRIEEEQRSYGNENLKILIDYYNYN